MDGPRDEGWRRFDGGFVGLGSDGDERPWEERKRSSLLMPVCGKFKREVRGCHWILHADWSVVQDAFFFVCGIQVQTLIWFGAG